MTLKSTSARVLFALSVSVCVTMIGLGIIWPLVPVYAVQMGAGGFLVGLIIASFNIARTIFSPFSGKISDMFGRKRFISFGLLSYALLSLLYVLPSQPIMLIFVRFFHGIAALFVVPIAMALAADIAPGREMGKYMGTLNMAVMLGLGIGPILGGTIQELMGIHAAFYTMGFFALAAFFLVLFLIPPDTSEKTEGDKKQISPFLKIMSNRIVLGIFLMRFFLASGQGAVYTFLPILSLKMSLSGSEVGILLGVNIFLIAFLQRICGNLADRFNPKFLISLGTFVSGIAVLGMPFGHGFTVMLMLNILMGAANGVSMPGGLVITGQLGRTMGMASLMSITDAAWSLGMIFSPILSGIILDLFGVAHVFVIGAILIISGSIIVTGMLWNYRPENNC